MNDSDACVLCTEPRTEGDGLFCSTHRREQEEQSHQRAVSSAWHGWINERQDKRRAAGELWEGSLYEFKDALEELRRLPIWLKRARTGTLPTSHRQCSHQEAVPIPENRLLCALGQDVRTCPILASLYQSVAVSSAPDGPRVLTQDDADQLAANTCVWHIYTTKLLALPHLDTSEGYVQDSGDRMFWSTLYDNLSATDVSS